MSRLSHHHTRGSSDVGIAGIFLYNSISCRSFVGIETLLLASAHLLFRALSSASKSSSSADNLSLLENGAWKMKMKGESQQEILNQALKMFRLPLLNAQHHCAQKQHHLVTVG